MSLDISLNSRDLRELIKSTISEISDISLNSMSFNQTSLDISVNSTNYLPQFYSNVFSQSFDSFKISYILLLGLVVLGFVIIFALFGNLNGDESGTSTPVMLLIEIILWIVLILVIGINITKYDYAISFKNLFNSNTAELDVNVNGTEAVNEEENNCKRRDSSGCLIHEDKTKDDMLLEWIDEAQINQPELKKQFEKYLITQEIKSVDPELSKEFEKFFREKENKENKDEKQKEKEKENEEEKKKCEENQNSQLRQMIVFAILICVFFSTIVTFFTGIMFGIIAFVLIVFVIYIFVYRFGYLDKINNNYSTCYDKIDDKCDNDSESEVFHIPNNKHSYEKARSICSKYNARLATYSEVEDSYNNGANWCSYGWSEDQLALFPTQLDIYNNLKLIPGHENDCGRPGVNGGFINNVHVKFGVNCFGKKPELTDQDKEYMDRLKLSYSPAIDPAELDKINNMLIAPFNKDKWSYQ